ncbi:cystathionine gamma-lyase [Neorhodopirellula lusitana]|uniref:Cystathionine gamma-lyase n=1 Tax=Neorhodopirellula lusitana TaxID=445327 RepID=A0ABY1PQW5_9BACT|nr:PLP-dependent aspartate aminotransferase family protein [Neorhodopirellula lusitana]SMP39177.1 cystathionine gamma-lyase [Neorhodopirellula lusitana]
MSGFRTRAIHVGNEVDPATGAVVRPVHFASTFQQPGAGEWGSFDYSRSGNPTRSALQETLTSLEDGCGSLAFSSGMAAIHAVTMLLRSGDHVLAGSDMYGGAYRLLHKICKATGITVSMVDMTDLAAVGAGIREDTRLIWVESIGNPRMSIVDLPEIAKLAKQRGVLTGVDNTFGTPVLMRPLQWGIDIVMHSATKYLGGHSDCLGGTLSVADPDLWDRLYFVQNATGAVLDPMTSFLVSRGLKTLDIRVREQSRSAMHLAEWLESLPLVRSVLYPGLKSHPQYALASHLFDQDRPTADKRFGAMITFELNASLEDVKRVCESTKLFHLAVSLGAVESLIEQPATMSHASYAPEDRAKHGITDSLIRLSVGLEDVEDLKADLMSAFESIQRT